MNWSVAIGSGTLTPTTATTDSAGYGRSTLHVSQLSGDVQGTVCVAPGNAPCQTFYVLQVLPSVLKLQPVSGSFQTILVGQTFQPISVRVTNSATPPNPVMGVPVSFQSMIFLPDADAPVESSGDDGSSQHAMKVLLGSSLTTLVTDSSGLVTLPVSTGGFSRPLEVEITASAGTATPLQFELPMLPAISPTPGGSTGRPRRPAPVAGRSAAAGSSSLAQVPEKASEEQRLSPAPIPLMVDPVGESNAMPLNSTGNQPETSACPHAEESTSRSADEAKKCDEKQDPATSE